MRVDADESGRAILIGVVSQFEEPLTGLYLRDFGTLFWDIIL